MEAAKHSRLRLPTATKTRAHLSVMGFRDFLAMSGREAELPEKPTADNPDVVVPLQPAADSAQEPIEWEAIPNGHLLRLEHDPHDQLHFHVTPVVSSAPPQGFLSRLLGRLRGKRGHIRRSHAR